jgi:hypothetical protein
MTPIKVLKKHCEEKYIDTSGCFTRDDLEDALKNHDRLALLYNQDVWHINRTTTHKTCNRVIFLDVDGVLNDSMFPHPRILPSAVALLKGLLDTTGAKIVISSTWRYRVELKAELLEALKAGGISEEDVIGETPNIAPKRRLFEIGNWLENNRVPLDCGSGGGGGGSLYEFVVLDDIKMETDRGVWTSARVGLQQRDVDEAIRLFGVSVNKKEGM